MEHSQSTKDSEDTKLNFQKTVLHLKDSYYRARKPLSPGIIPTVMRKPHISFQVLLSQHPSRAGMLRVRPQPSQALPVVSPLALACLCPRGLIPIQPSRHLRSTCHAPCGGLGPASGLREVVGSIV